MKTRLTAFLLCCAIVLVVIGAARRTSDYAALSTLYETNLIEVAAPGVTNFQATIGTIASNLEVRAALRDGLAKTRLVFEGDSLTWLGQPTNTSWTVWLTNSFFTSPHFVWGTNAAESGETAVTQLGQYTSQIQPFKPAGGTNAILFLRGGVVDLFWQTNTAVQIFNAISNEATLAKSDGFRVCMFTITDPGVNTELADGMRRDVNSAILAATNLWDWCVDMSGMFPNNNLVVTYDGLHFTYKSNFRIAQAVADVMLGRGQPTALVPQTRYISFSASNVTVKSLTGDTNVTFGAVNLTNAGVNYRNSAYQFKLSGSFPWLMQEVPGSSFYVQAALSDGEYFYAHGGGGNVLSSDLSFVLQTNKTVALKTNLTVAGSVGATNGVSTPGLSLTRSNIAPAFATGQGAHLFSDGTNLLFVLENSAGTRTTNKATFTAWP